MMENAIYSVISPEGCAAILWNDSTQKERAADALKLTATDLHGLGIIDEVVTEPPGGAHADPDGAATALSAALRTHVAQVADMKPEERIRRRADKYRAMGHFVEN